MVKIFGKSKLGKFFWKMLGYIILQFFIRGISRPFETNFCELSENQGNNGLNSISQYRPCIPDKFHFIIKRCSNFEARLWKCYYVKMNFSSNFTTSRRCCEFDVAITTSMICCEEMYHPTWRQHWYYVVYLTLRFQHSNKTAIIHL